MYNRIYFFKWVLPLAKSVISHLAFAISEGLTFKAPLIIVHGCYTYYIAQKKHIRVGSSACNHGMLKNLSSRKNLQGKSTDYGWLMFKRQLSPPIPVWGQERRFNTNSSLSRNKSYSQALFWVIVFFAQFLGYNDNRFKRPSWYFVAKAKTSRQNERSSLRAFGLATHTIRKYLKGHKEEVWV